MRIVGKNVLVGAMFLCFIGWEAGQATQPLLETLFNLPEEPRENPFMQRENTAGIQTQVQGTGAGKQTI